MEIEGHFGFVEIKVRVNIKGVSLGLLGVRRCVFGAERRMFFIAGVRVSILALFFLRKDVEVLFKV